MTPQHAALLADATGLLARLAPPKDVLPTRDRLGAALRAALREEDPRRGSVLREAVVALWPRATEGWVDDFRAEVRALHKEMEARFDAQAGGLMKRLHDLLPAQHLLGAERRVSLRELALRMPETAITVAADSLARAASGQNDAWGRMLADLDARRQRLDDLKAGRLRLHAMAHEEARLVVEEATRRARLEQDALRAACDISVRETEARMGRAVSRLQEDAKELGRRLRAEEDARRLVQASHDRMAAANRVLERELAAMRATTLPNGGAVLLDMERTVAGLSTRVAEAEERGDLERMTLGAALATERAAAGLGRAALAECEQRAALCEEARVGAGSLDAAAMQIAEATRRAVLESDATDAARIVRLAAVFGSTADTRLQEAEARRHEAEEALREARELLAATATASPAGHDAAAAKKKQRKAAAALQNATAHETTARAALAASGLAVQAVETALAESRAEEARLSEALKQAEADVAAADQELRDARARATSMRDQASRLLQEASQKQDEATAAMQRADQELQAAAAGPDSTPARHAAATKALGDARAMRAEADAQLAAANQAFIEAEQLRQATEASRQAGLDATRLREDELRRLTPDAEARVRAAEAGLQQFRAEEERLRLAAEAAEKQTAVAAKRLANAEADALAKQNALRAATEQAEQRTRDAETRLATAEADALAKQETLRKATELAADTQRRVWVAEQEAKHATERLAQLDTDREALRVALAAAVEEAARAMAQITAAQQNATEARRVAELAASVMEAEHRHALFASEQEQEAAAQLLEARQQAAARQEQHRLALVAAADQEQEAAAQLLEAQQQAAARQEEHRLALVAAVQQERAAVALAADTKRRLDVATQNADTANARLQLAESALQAAEQAAVSAERKVAEKREETARQLQAEYHEIQLQIEKAQRAKQEALADTRAAELEALDAQRLRAAAAATTAERKRLGEELDRLSAQLLTRREDANRARGLLHATEAELLRLRNEQSDRQRDVKFQLDIALQRRRAAAQSLSYALETEGLAAMARVAADAFAATCKKCLAEETARMNEAPRLLLKGIEALKRLVKKDDVATLRTEVKRLEDLLDSTVDELRRTAAELDRLREEERARKAYEDANRILGSQDALATTRLAECREELQRVQKLLETTERELRQTKDAWDADRTNPLSTANYLNFPIGRLYGAWLDARDTIDHRSGPVPLAAVLDHFGALHSAKLRSTLRLADVGRNADAFLAEFTNANRILTNDRHMLAQRIERLEQIHWFLEEDELHPGDPTDLYRGQGRVLPVALSRQEYDWAVVDAPHRVPFLANMYPGPLRFAHASIVYNALDMMFKKEQSTSLFEHEVWLRDMLATSGNTVFDWMAWQIAPLVNNRAGIPSRSEELFTLNLRDKLNDLVVMYRHWFYRNKDEMETDRSVESRRQSRRRLYNFHKLRTAAV